MFGEMILRQGGIVAAILTGFMLGIKTVADTGRSGVMRCGQTLYGLEVLRMPVETQIGQHFAIDVQSFGIGGDIGFEPLDINGSWLPNCPQVEYVQPIVTNTATCTAAPAPAPTFGASATVYLSLSLGV
jgi:hypothetical protein